MVVELRHYRWSGRESDGHDHGDGALDAEVEIDFELVVQNVPPDVDAGPDASITSNDTFDFSGSFSDPGVIDSAWDWQIDWGDGMQDSGSALDQALPIDASHQFCTAQDYTVSLNVTDKDGDTGVDDMTAHRGALPGGHRDQADRRPEQHQPGQ